MEDLATRIDGRMQFTTDGHKAYLDAVAASFMDGGVDYAMLVELYGEVPEAAKGRYSPAELKGARD